MELKLHCFFCGGKVEERSDRQGLRCSGCAALFNAERDPQGCIIGLQVRDCGTPDCCRHRSGRRPGRS